MRTRVAIHNHETQELRREPWAKNGWAVRYQAPEKPEEGIRVFDYYPPQRVVSEIVKFRERVGLAPEPDAVWDACNTFW